MNDPKMSIKDLLKDNWEATNTSGVTPNIHTGWYDLKSNTPQVTVTNSSEVAVSGGVTGYFGIATNGAPAQYWEGSMMVDCWTTREASSVNPKQLTFEFKEEIKRIIQANYGVVTDLDWIAWLGGPELVDDKQSPVVYRLAGTVRYGFLD